MTEQLDAIFSALSAPTRRAIVARLATGEAPVADIAAQFEISPPAVSRHLKILEDAGLIARRVEAQRRIISLNPEALRLASRWVDEHRRFWEASLERLENLLANDADKDPAKSGKDTSDEQPGKPRR